MFATSAAAHAGALPHLGLKALLVAACAVVVLFAIRGITKSAPAGPAVVVQSSKGLIALAIAAVAVVVIWVKAHGHQAAHIARAVHAAPAPHRHIVTHTVIRHAATYAGLSGTEALVICIAIAGAVVLRLNHR